MTEELVPLYWTHELGPFLEWEFYLSTFLFIETDSQVAQAGLQCARSHGQPWTPSCSYASDPESQACASRPRRNCVLHVPLRPWGSERWMPCWSPKVEAGREVLKSFCESRCTFCPYYQELFCDLCHLCVLLCLPHRTALTQRRDIQCGRPFQMGRHKVGCVMNDLYSFSSKVP